MALSRTAALRALARPAIRVRFSQPHASIQRYSSTSSPAKASSNLPWALSAILATAAGTYVALQPREPGHHVDHHAEGHEEAGEHKEEEKPKEHPILDKLEEKKEAHKEEIEKIKAALPKPERDGESVKNHGIAAEKNEHKIRQGKFCDDEFDNHITVHSDDPGKDFEKIKKEKAKQ